MSDLAVRRDGASIIEAVITKGDLGKLTPVERTQYYNRVCESVGLNPYTRPFEYITLNSKLTLYARREATDQLRQIHGISLEVVSQEVVGDIVTVHVRARDKTGRTDEDFGSVSIKGLAGEALANARMKALTKGKRRVTLSISGLGFLDESEVEGIPAHERAAPADTRSRLDQFAGSVGAGLRPDPASAPPDIMDAGTDEIFNMEQIEREAREVALRGTEILRDHLRSLPPEAREMLRDAVGTGEAPGALLIAARRADADAIGERLRMATTEPPDGSPPSERPSPRPAAASKPSGETAEPG